MMTSTLNAVRSSLLGFASLAFGAIFACALPFAALATAAARTMPAGLAYGLVALTWFVDQVLGFTVRHYPRDGSTVAWGLVIGLAAVAATAAARRAPTFTLGFVFAFVTDQLVLVAYAAIKHSFHGFSPAIVGQMALLNTIALAILGALAFAPELIARGRPANAGPNAKR
jgi:hypothetical protein